MQRSFPKGLLVLGVGVLLFVMGGRANGQAVNTGNLPADERADRSVADGGQRSGVRTTAQWRRQLLQWRKVVVSHKSVDPAFSETSDQMLAVTDEAAVPAIIGLLGQERDLRVKSLYWEMLARLGGPAAAAALADAAVLEQDRGARKYAASRIARLPDPKQAIPRLAGYLRTDKTAIVAAEAVRESGLANRQSEAEPINKELAYALVDGLLVTSRERVRNGNRREARRSGTTFNWAYHRESSTWFMVIEVPNENALRALRQHTLTDYGYDQTNWRHALATSPRSK